MVRTNCWTSLAKNPTRLASDLPIMPRDSANTLLWSSHVQPHGGQNLHGTLDPHQHCPVGPCIGLVVRAFDSAGSFPGQSLPPSQLGVLLFRITRSVCAQENLERIRENARLINVAESAIQAASKAQLLCITSVMANLFLFAVHLATHGAEMLVATWRFEVPRLARTRIYCSSDVPMLQPLSFVACSLLFSLGFLFFDQRVAVRPSYGCCIQTHLSHKQLL